MLEDTVYILGDTVEIPVDTEDMLDRYSRDTCRYSRNGYMPWITVEILLDIVDTLGDTVDILVNTT